MVIRTNSRQAPWCAALLAPVMGVPLLVAALAFAAGVRDELPADETPAAETGYVEVGLDGVQGCPELSEPVERESPTGETAHSI